MKFAAAKALTLMSLAFISTFTLANEDVQLGCTSELNGYYFNLHHLRKPIDQENRIESNMYNLEFEDVNGTSTIQFNLCEKTARQCPDEMDDYANIINGVGTCNHLSRTL